MVFKIFKMKYIKYLCFINISQMKMIYMTLFNKLKIKFKLIKSCHKKLNKYWLIELVRRVLNLEILQKQNSKN